MVMWPILSSDFSDDVHAVRTCTWLHRWRSVCTPPCMWHTLMGLIIRLSPRSHQCDLSCELTSRTLIMPMELFKPVQLRLAPIWKGFMHYFWWFSCATCIYIWAWSSTDVGKLYMKLHWPVALKLRWSSTISKPHSAWTRASEASVSDSPKCDIDVFL